MFVKSWLLAVLHRLLSEAAPLISGSRSRRRCQRSYTPPSQCLGLGYRILWFEVLKSVDLWLFFCVFFFHFDDLWLSPAGSVFILVWFQIAGKDLLEQCERMDQLMYGKYRSYCDSCTFCAWLAKMEAVYQSDLVLSLMLTGWNAGIDRV